MNKIIIIISLLLSLVAQKTYSQAILGENKNTLISSLSNDKTKIFVNVGKSSDGLSYALYKDAIDVQLMHIYYFGSDDTCISAGFIIPSVNYPSLLKYINSDKGNISLGGDIWENKEKGLRLSLRPIPNSNNILYQQSKLL